MSRYQFTASDIYLTGTDIPKNHWGITEPELLHEVEETLLQQAYQIFISECETSTRFDEIYFKALLVGTANKCIHSSLHRLHAGRLQKTLPDHFAGAE